MILTAKRHKALAGGVLLAAAALGGGTSYVVTSAGQQADENAASIEAVRSAQVAACKSSLERPDGIRFVLARQIRRGIKRDRHDLAQQKALPASYFPGIPPAEFRRLQRENAQRLKRRIHRDRKQARELLAVDCVALYPSARR